MTKEQIIKEIIKRFKLDSASIKQMKEYEYILIYKSFSEISPEIIDKAIESYKNKDFKLKAVRTTYH